jgi:hypothetical protein
MGLLKNEKDGGGGGSSIFMHGDTTAAQVADNCTSNVVFRMKMK